MYLLKHVYNKCTRFCHVVRIPDADPRPSTASRAPHPPLCPRAHRRRRRVQVGAYAHGDHRPGRQVCHVGTGAGAGAPGPSCGMPEPVQSRPRATRSRIECADLTTTLRVSESGSPRRRVGAGRLPAQRCRPRTHTAIHCYNGCSDTRRVSGPTTTSLRRHYNDNNQPSSG